MFIYGRNAVHSYFDTKQSVLEVYLQEGFKDETLIALIPVGVKVNNLKVYELRKLLGEHAVHQGIAIKVPDFKFETLEGLLHKIEGVTNPVIVMLDGIQDPHNLGAIIRTCDALGVNGVIIPERRSATITPTVIKVATGATDYVPIVQVTNLTRTLQKLKEHKFWVVGAEAWQAQDYRSVDYNSPIVVVLGNEGDGISRLVLEQCDFRVKLPMCGHVDSLNVSVATAVLLYGVYNSRHPL